MTTIRRLTDSCLVITTDQSATLLDPGAHTFESGIVDLGSIGDITRVLITHEHGDHLKPEFVAWLRDRNRDLTVHCNSEVAAILATNDVEASTDDPPGVVSEDVVHELTPLGTAPPNRVFTVEDVLTHPGDSYQASSTGRVLALPLIVPWGSATRSLEFAKRLAPSQVVPVHDFYLSDSGKTWIVGLMKGALAQSGIEMIPLDWGESASL